MRTATPFVTWSRIRDGSESATSLPISTTLHLEGKHAAKGRHLAQGRLPAGAIRESGVVDRLDPRVPAQKLGHL